jgi:hypothetical protein
MARESVNAYSSMLACYYYFNTVENMLDKDVARGIRWLHSNTYLFACICIADKMCSDYGFVASTLDGLKRYFGISTNQKINIKVEIYVTILLKEILVPKEEFEAMYSSRF